MMSDHRCIALKVDLFCGVFESWGQDDYYANGNLKGFQSREGEPSRKSTYLSFLFFFC